MMAFLVATGLILILVGLIVFMRSMATSGHDNRVGLVGGVLMMFVGGVLWVAVMVNDTSDIDCDRVVEIDGVRYIAEDCIE